MTGDVAYKMLLEKLREKTADPEKRGEITWVLTGETAKRNPPKLDEKTLRSYAGVYGERKVTLKDGALHYQRIGPEYRLIPLSERLFALEDMDNFRVEFEVKDGKVTGLVGLYDDGERQPSARTGS